MLGEPRRFVGVSPGGPLGLLARVVRPVGRDGVVGPLVLVGHRLRTRRRLLGGELDRVGVDLLDNFPAGVIAVLLVALDELRVERLGVVAQAKPVRPRLRRPLGDGVAGVGRRVQKLVVPAVLAGRGTQHLRGLEQ